MHLDPSKHAIKTVGTPAKRHLLLYYTLLQWSKDTLCKICAPFRRPHPDNEGSRWPAQSEQRIMVAVKLCILGVFHNCKKDEEKVRHGLVIYSTKQAGSLVCRIRPSVKELRKWRTKHNGNFNPSTINVFYEITPSCGKKYSGKMGRTPNLSLADHATFCAAPNLEILALIAAGAATCPAWTARRLFDWRHRPYNKGEYRALLN